jgi:hypothetical protein
MAGLTPIAASRWSTAKVAAPCPSPKDIDNSDLDLSCIGFPAASQHIQQLSHLEFLRSRLSALRSALSDRRPSVDRNTEEK